MWGISWANLSMLLAAIPSYESDAATDSKNKTEEQGVEAGSAAELNELLGGKIF